MNPAPVTPAQAHAVYSALHVTAAMIRLDHHYEFLYFLSIFLHIVVRVAFAALGFSASLRSQSERIAGLVLDWRIVDRCKSFFATILSGTQIEFLYLAIELRASRFIPSIRRLKDHWNAYSFRTTVIYFLLYTALFTALWLPLTYYSDFYLPHQFGLSRENLLNWSGDLFKDAAVDAFFGAFVAAFALWGIAIFPKKWSIVFAILSGPFILLGIFLDPFFDRIDNSFTPLQATNPLYAPLHELANRAGVPKASIFVVDKSRQTEETNAYVTGLGSSAQIVLWDTTIHRMKADEVIAIVGHELGHYVEHHVLIGGVIGSLAMFLYFPLLKICADAIVQRFGARWKIASLADPAALPIFFLLIGLFSFIASPLVNAVSRVIEHRADSFGLALTQNRIAMATAMVDLANENMENPFPKRWEVVWLDDHPPVGERISFALHGRPMTVLQRR